MKNKKKDEEILCLLSTLSNISNKKSKDHSEEMVTHKFKIKEYSFTLYFIYNSVSINIWCGSNFYIFTIIFHDGKYNTINNEEVKKLLNIVCLPPDLIISTLRDITVREV